MKVCKMNDAIIRTAWYELVKYFGPDFFGRDSALKNKAQVYAKAVLDYDDKERIKYIGKRHLKLVTDKLLDGEQFSQFLQHVISYERFSR